jgi:hypothetical protein
VVTTQPRQGPSGSKGKHLINLNTTENSVNVRHNQVFSVIPPSKFPITELNFKQAPNINPGIELITPLMVNIAITLVTLKSNQIKVPPQ